MGKKRTRQDKIMAKLRREAEVAKQKEPVISYKAPVSGSEKRYSFYTPELTLPMKLISFDLTKTLIVTILALILQIGLAVYLNRGGWPIIKTWF